MAIFQIVTWFGSLEFSDFAPWISTGILTALSCVLAYYNAKGSKWQGAAQALEKELGAVRGRCERLEAQNTQLTKDNSELQAKVDLTPIRDGLANLTHLTADQYAQTSKAFIEVTKILHGIEKRLAAFSGEILPPR